MPDVLQPWGHKESDMTEWTELTEVEPQSSSFLTEPLNPYCVESFDDYGYVLKGNVNYAELVNKVMTYSSLIGCEPSHIQVFYY